jgi:GNAT superfamily N-acetyltransferase
MSKLYTSSDITEIVRNQARLHLSEFDPTGWYANEAHVLMPQLFRIRRGPTESGNYGYYDFLVDLQKKSSYKGNLYLTLEYRGRGMGRKLVEMREDVCRDLSINLILIDDSTNPSFWNHMGYEPATKEILFENWRLRGEPSQEPRVKHISRTICMGGQK